MISFFDMRNGIFVPVPPVHGNYANPEISDILARFFLLHMTISADISLKRSYAK